MRPYVILLANLASHSDDNRIFKPMKFHNPVRCNYRFCFGFFVPLHDISFCSTSVWSDLFGCFVNMVVFWRDGVPVFVSQL